MKKNNLKLVKIDKNKSLFNYEKKILINELILDLKLGYYDFEKEKEQKVKLQLQINLLYDHNLDLDLLDELARKDFAVLKEQEKLLILKKENNP